jgi:hypothetical protein
MEVDRQIDENARENNQSLDDRIEQRITTLRQIARVFPKRARDIQAADKASQTLAEFAGLDKEIEASKTEKSLSEVFTVKHIVMENQTGDHFLQLAAAGDAVTQVAEIVIALKEEIEVFIKQVHRDLGRTITTEDQKEQVTKNAVKYVLEQVDQARAKAKAANQDFGIQDQAVALRKARLEARVDVISSTEMIGKTVTKVAQEMNAAVEATIKLRELSGPQLIKAYDRYAGSSSLAEQAERQKIEAFIDDEANGVHYYYRNQLNLRRAYVGALRHNYYDSMIGGVKKPGEVYEYLKRLVTKTEFHQTEQGALREALEHSVVDAIRSGINMVRNEGMDDDLMLPILTKAIQELATRSRNLKLAEKTASPETTPDKAMQSLEKMTIAEAQPPEPDAKDDKTKAKDVPLDEMFVKYKRKGSRQWHYKVIPGKREKVKFFDFEAVERMSPAEKTEYANKVSNTLFDSANLLFDKMLENLDTEQRFLIEQKRGEWIDKQHERLLKIHDRSEAMQFQLYKLRLFRKEMNKQRWKDAMVQWALLWLKQGVDGASKGANTFMSEFIKIMMKALT